MKKLNRKGFTLIELLAVIVILAIIVVVTVPTMISVIDDARQRSIWELAGGVAETYNNDRAQSLLTGAATLPVDDTWHCITSDQAKELNLAVTDVVIGTTVPTISGTEVSNVSTACSAIKVRSDYVTEVVLIAAAGGQFDIANYYVYGYTGATNGAKVAKP